MDGVSRRRKEGREEGLGGGEQRMRQRRAYRGLDPRPSPWSHRSRGQVSRCEALRKSFIFESLIYKLRVWERVTWRLCECTWSVRGYCSLESHQHLAGLWEVGSALGAVRAVCSQVWEAQEDQPVALPPLLSSRCFCSCRISAGLGLCTDGLSRSDLATGALRDPDSAPCLSFLFPKNSHWPQPHDR